jgi:3-methylfumaryl-CoA hydratase
MLGMTAPTNTTSPWDAWIGREERRVDLLTPAPVAALAATLDRDDPPPRAGTELPPLWHWLYFLPQTLARDIGPDGHAKRGGFLPPVPLPRRMWAGSRIHFDRPLLVGDEVTRTSRILKVSAKDGQTGPLVFVTVQHLMADVRGIAWTEEHDIVYRDAPAPGAAAPQGKPAPRDEQFSRRITPDPVLLFRYSALTFNGHRIHYDRSYVTEVEGYPGLIVHGPLIATLLLDLLRRERPQARVEDFEFKAMSPLFDIHAFEVCGKELGDGRYTLWARDHSGALAMQASVQTR